MDQDNEEVQMIQETKQTYNRKKKAAASDDEEDVELNSKHADSKLVETQKTREEYRQSLQTLIVFLCAASHFGNSFCGNSQSPLQQEIETYLKIDDPQFNLFFSVRAISSIVVPFGLPWFLERAGIRTACIMFATCGLLGQWVFILGLEHKNYYECLFSRLIFGVGDSMTILQQTIMCLWFSPEQLPIAFSMLLFMVKLVRAINDNTASIVYNRSHTLETFFWIGLAICVFSLGCATLLTWIHAWVIETKVQKASAEKEKELQNQKIQVKKGGPDDKNALPREAWLVVISMTSGLAAIQGFYPNMSKFLQQNYGMTNIDAGHLTSVPYIVASIAVPLLGHLLAYCGPKTYEKFLAFSACLIAFAQVAFFAIQQHVGADGLLQNQWVIVFPCLCIGFGHALQATVQGPLVNKLVEQKMIPRVFSVLKIFEGSILAIVMYINGHVRQSMGNYTGVSLLIVLESSTCAMVALYLNNLTELGASTSPKDEGEKARSYKKIKKNEYADAQATESGGLMDPASNSTPPNGQELQSMKGSEEELSNDNIEEEEDLETPANTITLRKKKPSLGYTS